MKTSELTGTHVSLERLMQVLHYDQDTGTFTWAAPTSIRVQEGDEAGSVASVSGGRVYRQIAIDGVSYYANVLAWFYVTGVWPQSAVGYRNADGLDTRFGNLRLMQKNEIQHSREPTPLRNNTTGFLGVSRAYRKNGARWEAKIKIGGRRMTLGIFDTAEEASAVYLKVKRALAVPSPQ